MKITILIPDRLFEAAEREAARRKVSRRRFYSLAVASYLRTLRAENIRKVLDSVYATEDSSLDPALHRVQSQTLGREDW